MSLLKSISYGISQISEWVGKTIAWLTLAMVLLTFTIVVMRYVFNEGSIALQESVIYMHAIVFMLGASYTLSQDAHVRVDIFYGAMSFKKKAMTNLFGNIVFLIPMSIFILWSSWGYVVDAWEVKESSREPGGLPWVYILKASIIAMGGLLILQAIANIFSNIADIFSKETPDQTSVTSDESPLEGEKNQIPSHQSPSHHNSNKHSSHHHSNEVTK